MNKLFWVKFITQELIDVMAGLGNSLPDHLQVPANALLGAGEEFMSALTSGPKKG